MQRRIAAVAAALALVAGGGVATAGSPDASSAAPGLGRAVADTSAAPVRLHRSDLRSSSALVQAYRSMLTARAERLRAAGEVVVVFGGITEALPVGDVDGDRATDVLEIRGNAAKGPAVALRSGRTGRERWSATSEGLFWAQYVAVPGGHPLVLTYATVDDGTDAFLAYAGTTTLTVEARDAATGAVAWTSSWTGVLSFTPASAALVGLAFPSGVLATKPGQHPILLLDRHDYVYSDVTETADGSMQYVDAVTGDATATSDLVQGEVSFCPVGDLDGDGTDDVVRVSAADSGVTALSGADPQQALWSVQRPELFDYGWADPSPDMTGDRRPDLLLGSATFDEDLGRAAALDGRTGHELWQRTAGSAQPTGDVDHDGRGDTRLFTSRNGAYRYTVVSGRGRTMWDTTVTNTTAGTAMMSWLAGDLDADGVQDSYVRLVERGGSFSSPAKGSFLVDGRTGRLTAQADLGVPIGASLDGRGVDLVRMTTVLSRGAQRVLLTLVDGRTKRDLWRREVPVASSANLVDVWAGDYSGTGRPDLLEVVTEPDRAVLVVQHGRTGRTTWSAGYDTRGGFKPF